MYACMYQKEIGVLRRSSCLVPKPNLKQTSEILFLCYDSGCLHPLVSLLITAIITTIIILVVLVVIFIHFSVGCLIVASSNWWSILRPLMMRLQTATPLKRRFAENEVSGRGRFIG